MALIDIVCPNGHLSEVYRAAVDWPTTPPCPECQEATEQTHLPKSVRWTPEPVVVYQASDGSFRFPGDANGLSARNYERQGLQRVEIRSAADMRRFEKHMSAAERSTASRKLEQKEAQREVRQAQMRGELRSLMSGMSRAGRDLARAVMARTDGKPKERVQDSGFMSEVYSMDRSNRDESRDAQGRRRRD